MYSLREKTFRSTPMNSGLNDHFRAFQQQNATMPQEPAANRQLLSPHLGNLPSYPAQASTLFPPQPMPAFSQSLGGSWVDDFHRMTLPNIHARPLHNQPAQSPVVGQPSLVNPMPSNFSRFPVFEHYQSPASIYEPTSMYSTQRQLNDFPASNDTHTSQFMGT